MLIKVETPCADTKIDVSLHGVGIITCNQTHPPTKGVEK